MKIDSIFVVFQRDTIGGNTFPICSFINRVDAQKCVDYQISHNCSSLFEFFEIPIFGHFVLPSNLGVEI